MLYDPKKWKTKADPLSLDSLIAWLERQQPDRYYPATDARFCLLAQWLRSMDPNADTRMGCPSFWYNFNGEPINLIAFYPVVISNDGKRTFGAALERARALHMETQP